MLRACVLMTLLAGTAGCGRAGFDALADGPPALGDAGDVIARGDAPLIPDADPAAPDAAIGSGGYTVAVTTAPYVAPVGGTLVPGFMDGADEETWGVALPFPFTFYGLTYDTVTVSVNGFVTFAVPPTDPVESYDNDCPIDATAPDAMIAVFWDDLFASAMYDPRGSITFLAEGAAPDRRFTIEWKDLDAFYKQGANYFGQKMRVTHKLVLFENGAIELDYGPRTPPVYDKDCGLDRHRGCSATVGIEASGGLSSMTQQCGTSAGPTPPFTPIDEGLRITYTPM